MLVILAGIMRVIYAEAIRDLDKERLDKGVKEFQEQEDYTGMMIARRLNKIKLIE